MLHQEDAKSERSDRLSSGVPGLDRMLSGGFPRNSLVLIGGSPGAGKTVLASHYLYEGARRGEPGIYVSFAESKDQFLSNMARFGMRFRRLIDEGTFRFLDMATVSSEGVSDALDVILSQVVSMKAKRLVIDSFSALSIGFKDQADARIALHVIFGKTVRNEGCTTLVITEKPDGRHAGLEEFVADGIVSMDVSMRKGGPRRSITIRKMRGTRISLQPSAYDISDEGLTVFPSRPLRRTNGILDERLPTGVEGLDELIEGGLLRGSVTGVIGAAGVGKTTFTLQFVTAGARSPRERSLFLSFGEPLDQVRLVADKLGIAVRTMEAQGRLGMVHVVPELSTPESIAFRLQEEIERFRPSRVVLDDVTALDAICDEGEFYGTIRSIADSCQERGIALALSLTSGGLLGAPSITGRGVSTVMDNIVLLRYVEMDGKMERSMVLLKMRGTKHDNSIRKFTIESGGIRMEAPFRGVSGILAGTAAPIVPGERVTRGAATRRRARGSAQGNVRRAGTG